MKEETFYCLALTLIPGLGTCRLHPLLREWGSPAVPFRADDGELATWGFSGDMRAYIRSGVALKAAEKAADQAQKLEIHILSPYESAYPHLLREIYEPPLVLFCRGDPGILRLPGLALVGSRRCSVYGQEVTRKLARELASLGFNIVSGLARGIDSQAHRGALESGGRTVAVLGNGVDVVYPRENRRLYEEVWEQGCVVSEFPCGTFPAPQNFPIRNRIISGLCYGTVITEASEFSGSLITARLTLEQNRQLWAVPGNITRPGSYGPNYLLKQGAGLVMSGQDILDELPPYVLNFLARKFVVPGESQVKEISGGTAQGPAPEEERVLRLLSEDEAVHVDRLLSESRLEISQLNQALLHLELRGLVRQWPGRRFSRVHL